MAELLPPSFSETRTFETRNSSGALQNADATPTISVRVNNVETSTPAASTSETGIYTYTLNVPSSATAGQEVVVRATYSVNSISSSGRVILHGQVSETASRVYTNLSGPATITDCITTEGTSAGSGGAQVYIYTSNTADVNNLVAVTTTASDGTYTATAPLAGTYYAFYTLNGYGTSGPDTVTAV